VLYSINPVFQLKLNYQLRIEVSVDKPGLSVDKPGFSAINPVYRIKHTTACHNRLYIPTIRLHKEKRRRKGSEYKVYIPL